MSRANPAASSFTSPSTLRTSTFPFEIASSHSSSGVSPSRKPRMMPLEFEFVVDVLLDGPKVEVEIAHMASVEPGREKRSPPTFLLCAHSLRLVRSVKVDQKASVTPQPRRRRDFEGFLGPLTHPSVRGGYQIGLLNPSGTPSGSRGTRSGGPPRPRESSPPRPSVTGSFASVAASISDR